MIRVDHALIACLLHLSIIRSAIGAGLPPYNCSPGSYVAADGCKPCQVGYHSAGGSNTRCKRCPDGFTNLEPGSIECPLCAPGYAGASCKACPEGTHSPGGTLDECAPCPMPKLSECAKRSYCDPAKGLVIEWWPEGSSCREGGGVCKNNWCECKPGHGGPNCETCPLQSYSPGGPLGQDCQRCPVPAPFCKMRSGPCDMYPPCDQATGKPSPSLCWEPRPEGAPCQPDDFSGQLPDGPWSSSAFMCSNNECVERKESGPLCAPGTGGPTCEPCQEGYFSLGAAVGTECSKCPSQAICKRLPSACERLPPCDPSTGKPTSMCFVPRKEGAFCTPGDVTGGPVAADSMYVCRKGDCVAKAAPDACKKYPCSQVLDCAFSSECAKCKVLASPHSLKHTRRGRKCVCPSGMHYIEKKGCYRK